MSIYNHIYEVSGFINKHPGEGIPLGFNYKLYNYIICNLIVDKINL